MKKVVLKLRPHRPTTTQARWHAPSWVFSMLVHTAILVTLAVIAPRWNNEPVGFGDGISNELGTGGSSLGFDIGRGADAAMGQGDSGEAPDVAAGAEGSSEVATTAVMPSSIAAQLPNPLATQVLPAVPQVLGASGSNTSTGPLAVTPTAGLREFITGSAGGGQGGSGRGNGLPGGTGDGGNQGTALQGTGSGGGPPGAGFMGAKDRATRVVFVIDSSASMLNYGAMQAAKSALVSSLQSLVESQQFQIIFFNDKATLLKLQGKRDPVLVSANEINKTLARQEIAAVSPDFGTNRLEALMLALRMNPEAIFFLTDADEPQLDASELDQIARANRQKARIHTIEFGQGEPLGGPPNFLEKLARQSGGTYRYHNVKRLGVE